MKKAEKIYTSLCVLFSVLMVVGNLTYQKFVILSMFQFHIFELSVGAVLYPLTFLITDLIAEFFGKEKASFCISFAIIINIMVAVIIVGMDTLPATSWSKIDKILFHKVFGFYYIAFIGSIIACYISQIIDISLYLWIRKITNGKYLWIRNNASTAVSLFIDTCIVIIFMTASGVLSQEHMRLLIMNSYLWKLLFIICSTPLFYFCFNAIRRYIN
jgi:uncharacterized integral membrane protein (TIGR00697 family)